MKEEDEILLKTYYEGFNDELRGIVRVQNINTLLSCAYNLGRQDAIAGDDVRSVDNQTNEEILNNINMESKL